MNLKECVFQVRDSQKIVRGTAFAISPKLVVTCAHVVKACGVELGKSLTLLFYPERIEFEAEVLSDGWNEKEDVAFLRLNSPFPSNNIRVGELGSYINVPQIKRKFSAYGFPHLKANYQEILAHGLVVAKIQNNDRVSILQLESQDIAPGLSGAPVMDDDSGLIVGMVQQTYNPDGTLKFRDLAFALSSEIICELSPDELIIKEIFDQIILELIKWQKKRSESRLFNVQTSINFNGLVIEIDRSEELDKLKNDSGKILILSGSRGVGKTALIKNLYEQLKDKIPFYIFKANDFELVSIDNFFRDLNLQDFIEFHKKENYKIIVIDSAEKLMELNNREPFQEFLNLVIPNGWKLIFTTRDNYLEVLLFEFSQIYRKSVSIIDIQDLELQELYKISNEHHFLIPQDEKIVDLIKNPFYLNEYLKFYNTNEELDFLGFKDKLWKSIVTKCEPEREQCFILIAFTLASEGRLHAPNCEKSTLKELGRDGVLGYDVAYGYFIVHDIYEEWALEKKLKWSFLEKQVLKKYFKELDVHYQFVEVLGNGFRKNFR